MKKILSFLMAAVMSVSLFGTIINAEESHESVSSQDTERFNKLKAFGILEDYNLEDLTENSGMTRGEFAVMAAAANGADPKNAVVDEAPFKDVKADSDQGRAIGYLKELGVVAGDGESDFYPARTISLPEALKILVSLLGYGQSAYDNGGYPNGYLTTATRIGLSIGVQDREALKLSDAVNLMWSAVNTDLMLADGMTAQGMSSQIGRDRTLLTEKLKIFKGNGIVEANQYTALIGKQKAGDKSVLISGTVFDDLNYIACPYLGYEVDFYYHSDDDNNDIVYTAPDNSVETVTVNERDILITDGSFSQFNFVYSDGNRKKSIKLPKDVSVICNNEQVFEFDVNTFNISVGEITLISNDGGRKYSTVIIESYETIVVNTVDTNNNYVTDKLGKNIKLEFNGKTDDIHWNFVSGEGKDINDLKEWDVLSIKRDSSGEYMEVIVCNDFLEGTIDRVSPDDTDGIEIVVDGESHKMIKNYVQSDTNQYTPYLKPGSSAIFCMDFHGNIVAVDYDTSDEWQYAVLRKIFYDDNGETVFAKITDQNAKTYSYKLSDTVKVDAETCKQKSGDKLQTVMEKLQRGGVFKYQCSNPGSSVYQLVRIKLDEENNITDIDTTYEGTYEDYDSLRVLDSTPNLTDTQGVTKYWRDGYKMFGSTLGAKTTKLFYAPFADDMDNNDAFNVRELSYLSAGQRTFIPYGTSQNDVADIPILVLLGQTSSTAFERFAMVAESYAGVNDDNEVVTSLRVYIQGKERVYESEDTSLASKVHTGDIIRFKLDASENITQVQVFYSAKDKKIVTPLSSDEAELKRNNAREIRADDDSYYLFESDGSGSGAYARVVMTDAYTKFKTSSRLGLSSVYESSKNGNDFFNQKSSASITKNDLLEQYGTTNFDVVVYDEASDTVTKGSFENIKDYGDYPDTCSKVFAYTSYSESKDMFVFNYEN